MSERVSNEKLTYKYSRQLGIEAKWFYIELQLCYEHTKKQLRGSCQEKNNEIFAILLLPDIDRDLSVFPGWSATKQNKK